MKKPVFVTLIGIIFAALPVFGGPKDDLPVLRVPLEVAVHTLDPVLAEDFVTIRILMNLGSGLVTLDKNLKPVTELAHSWKISPDGVTYTFKLRKSKWSDGRPLTAGDFERGWKRVFDPNSGAKIAQPLTDVVKDFAALDKDTFQVRLKRRAPYFLSLLALPICFPIPEGPAPYKIGAGTATSGHYKIESIDNESIKLVPNGQARVPAINRVDFKIVTDVTTALNLYEKNQLDFIFKIPSSDFARFKDSPDMVQSPWLSTYYLGFNEGGQSPGQPGQRIFAQKELREAVIEAVDREGLKKILLDPQNISSSFVPAPLPTSDEHFGPTFDPADAKRKWTKFFPKNQKLTLFFDAQEKNALIGAYVQAQLKKNLGVDLQIQLMEWKSFLSFLKTNKPDFFRMGWLAAFPDPLSHLGVFTSTNPNNDAGYANPEYDALVKAVAETAPGPKRTDLIRKAQKKLLTDDVVIFPLYHYVQYILIRRGLRGSEVTPMGLLYFHRIHPPTS